MNNNKMTKQNRPFIEDERLAKSVNHAIDKLEAYFPEGKIFALDSIDSKLREKLTELYKKAGYETLDVMFAAYGFEVISGDDVKQIRGSVIYTPGNEPDCIKPKVESMLRRMNEYYPDKKICNSLTSEHKKLSITVSGLYQWLGYPNANEMLAAYGYTYAVNSTGGRPANDFQPVLDALVEKYKDIPKPKTMGELSAENPEIKGQLKTLANKSNQLFGMTLANYFKSIGILAGSNLGSKDHKIPLDELLAELRKRYPEGATLPTSLTQLKDENTDLKTNRLSYTKEVYGKKPLDYLVSVGLIRPLSTEEEFDAIVEELKRRYQNKCPAETYSQLKLNNADLQIHDFASWFQKTNGFSLSQYFSKEGLISPESCQHRQNIKVSSEDWRRQNIKNAAEKKATAGTLEFNGRIFAAAGLEANEKATIESIVSHRGGIYKNRAGKKTDYLIISSETPDRLLSENYRTVLELNEQGLGIQIYTYPDFLNSLEQNQNTDVKEFIIEKGELIRYIGKEANVDIPHNISKISDKAFADCVHLTSVTIPVNVTAIGDYAFEGCHKLKEVKFADESVVTIGKSAFRYCSSLIEISLPDSVIEIGERAFMNCPSLRSVKLSQKLTRIPYRAFCALLNPADSVLEEIKIPDGVKEIESEAFSCQSSLRKVHLPSQLKEYTLDAFEECAIERFEIDENSKYYSCDDYGVLFNKKKTKLIQVPARKRGTYIIPDSVTSIDEHAFRGCKYLRHVVFTGNKPPFKATIMWRHEGNRGGRKKCFQNFEGTEVKAYYPKNDATWDGIELQDFYQTSERNVTWIAYEDMPVHNGLLSDRNTIEKYLSRITSRKSEKKIRIDTVGRRIYELKVKANSTHEVESIIAVFFSCLVYGEDLTIEGVKEYGGITVGIDDDGLCKVEFDLSKWIFDDLPNPYIDDGHDDVYEMIREAVIAVSAAPFQIAFEFSEMRMDYCYSGYCMFDGEKIKYKGISKLPGKGPKEFFYIATYQNGEFTEEKYKV